MKKIIISFTLIICLFVLTACGSSNELIGTWEGATEDGLNTTFTFKSGNKVEYSNDFGFNSKGTYEIKDSKVTIKLESWDQSKVYEFEVKDESLSLKATDSLSPSYSNMKKK